jgi:16S rRNA C967 or C1407 C5-methylase (RsmB/RsmF family)
MTKRQRGFKKPKQKFFYKSDIFTSRIASVLKMPQSKVKGLLFQSNLYAVKFVNKEVKKFLKNYDFKAVPWAKDTYLVTRKEFVLLKKTKEYASGAFYIQNLAELLPVFILNPKTNNRVLDMYSGNSALNFSNLMKNQGEIIANCDEGIGKLIEALNKHRIKNVEVISERGEDLDKKYSEEFDKILLNAPSSREGIVHFSQKRPLKNWSIQKTKALSKLQKRLITTAFKCLKKGGLLVYTTATISPNENEEVVSFLLNENKNAVLEKIDLLEENNFKEYKPFIKKALKSWNNDTYHADIEKTIRTIPGKTMFGTYIALIRKV